MGTSLTIFRVYDINVRVHWSFLLILAYGAFAFSGDTGSPLVGAIYGVTAILLLFACVTLHEFGHALVARHYGIQVKSIMLLPIGGVANLEKLPEKPIQEFLIAVAGPLVNFGLALILLPVVLFTVGLEMRSGAMPTSVVGVLSNMQTPGLVNLLMYLLAMNLMLGLFNLLPAFPMDGGRVFRALLARRFPYTWATYTAARVGRWIALAIGLYGLFNNPFMILIAFFIWFAGGQEAAMVAHEVRMRGNSSGAGQSDIPRPRPERVRPVFQSTAYYSPGFNVDDLLRAQNRSRPQDASTGERQQEVEELFDRFFDDREK